ncbi:MAG: ATP-binding protein, partial [Promethearchaeota archaeon]
MFEEVLPQIHGIFVGREPELARLRGIWDLAIQRGEHLVYVLLNAPGIGKTTLIDHFGSILEERGEGLFVKVKCSSNHPSPSRLNNAIVEVVRNTLRIKSKLVEEYLTHSEGPDEREELREDLQALKKLARETSLQDDVRLGDVSRILVRLSRIIPIFFAADEIQEFQQLKFAETDETGLHYFSRLLKDLLDSKILIVLSGTRYHVLSQIGVKIGSPIRQKVEPVVITKLNPGEIDEYAKSVEGIVEAALEGGGGTDATGIPRGLFENYRQFLHGFSGGHPRTIVKLTTIFIQNLEKYSSSEDLLEYDRFVADFLPEAEKTFKTTLLSSEMGEELLLLSSSSQFSRVKRWILDGGFRGLFLGPPPTTTGRDAVNDEIDRIVYALMNLGVIVQNGQFQYYLTSYFHFLEFLRPFNEPMEAFLKQVLHNRFFQLMCGRHSGFGYTFENMLAAALLSSTRPPRTRDGIPIDPSRLKGTRLVRGELDWVEFDPDPDVLYQMPRTAGADFCVLQSSVLVLVQVTIGNPPGVEKIRALASLVERVEGVFRAESGTREGVTAVRGWFVSLFPVAGGTSRGSRPPGGAREPLVQVTSGEQLA